MGGARPLCQKKDGSLRMCIDYRDLNKLTVKTNILCLEPMTCLTNYKVRVGYHQLKVKEEDVPKTALCTQYGCYVVNKNMYKR
jgi:hypothetical protein